MPAILGLFVSHFAALSVGALIVTMRQRTVKRNLVEERQAMEHQAELLDARHDQLARAAVLGTPSQENHAVIPAGSSLPPRGATVQFRPDAPQWRLSSRINVEPARHRAPVSLLGANLREAEALLVTMHVQHERRSREFVDTMDRFTRGRVTAGRASVAA